MIHHTLYHQKDWLMLFNATKRFIVLFSLSAIFLHLPCSAQHMAVKSNALYWSTTTPNATLELGLSSKYSLNLTAAYNPWDFSRGRKMHLWAAQPALRRWFCERFEGHFVGVHAHAAQYYGGFKDKLYDGYLAGGGVSYGYAWLLSPHWNAEAEVGLGYARMWYKESERTYCEKCTTPRHHNYWGPTLINFSLAYVF